MQCIFFYFVRRVKYEWKILINFLWFRIYLLEVNEAFVVGSTGIVPHTIKVGTVQPYERSVVGKGRLDLFSGL